MLLPGSPAGGGPAAGYSAFLRLPRHRNEQETFGTGQKLRPAPFRPELSFDRPSLPPAAGT
jgi:hypothetical protein